MTQVLLFAQAREIAGTRSVNIDGVTVAEVLAAADMLFGSEFAQLRLHCTVMVDEVILLGSEFATASAGTELAILPPVSGGSDHARDHSSSGMRVAVLTVSDRASAGEYEDLTGPAVEATLLSVLDAQVVLRAVVPDERSAIVKILIQWCDVDQVDLVLTNGGTGLAPRDVTPEATREVLEVEAPGIGELMRSVGLKHTALAALSRQYAGRRGKTLIVNLPGSVAGATESLEAVIQILPHACATVRS
ncbi:MAG: molybdenum cofactor synthesis domain-containing protein [Microthrixaceae bacterium]